MKRLGPAHEVLVVQRPGKEPYPLLLSGVKVTIADVLMFLADRQWGVPQGESNNRYKAVEKVDAQAAEGKADIILDNDEHKLLVGMVEAAYGKEATQVHTLPTAFLRPVSLWLDDAVKYEPEKPETT